MARRRGAVSPVLFYPITLSKLAFYGPIWLVGVLVASRFLALRMTVILSLLAPMALGIILFILFRYELIPYKAAIPFFGLVNFRMVAVPSLAMDYYNEFFFKHELTYYCQIGVLKRFLACPYNEPLSIVIFNAFGIGGNFNASLFATEGVASVGPTFAPLVTFVCGLVIALGNRVSAGLPPLCHDFGRHFSADPAKCAVLDGAAHPWPAHPVSAVVCDASSISGG